MAASTSEFVSTLNGLIETCKDGENGFQTAADGVQKSDLKTMFNEYSRQRAQFAAELQAEVARIGGSPEKSGSVSAAVHRGWMDIKSAVTGKDDHAILAEAERGEDVAVKAYKDALSKDLPSDLRSKVESQYNQVLQAHNKVRAMRDGSSTSTAGTGATRTY